jgi:hypothetical protein
MFRRKVAKVVKRVVWRMSSTDPAGVYLFSTECEASPARPAEAHERDFRASSIELSAGADVRETAIDTLPGELIDEFARARR